MRTGRILGDLDALAVPGGRPASFCVLKLNFSAADMEHFPVWSLDKNAWRSFVLFASEAAFEPYG